MIALLAFAAAVRRAPARAGPPRAEDAPPPARASRVAGAIALAIGAYDGFFGPGTGTFLIVAFVGLLGDGLARASASAKVVNFASNLAALALFAARGVGGVEDRRSPWRRRSSSAAGSARTSRSAAATPSSRRRGGRRGAGAAVKLAWDMRG